MRKYLDIFLLIELCDCIFFKWLMLDIILLHFVNGTTIMNLLQNVVLFSVEVKNFIVDFISLSRAMILTMVITIFTNGGI